MQLPDFMSYRDRFANNGFIQKLSPLAKRAGIKLDKAIIIGALGYLISPLDVVPDAIPIAGFGDDLAVLLYVLHKIWGEVSDDVKEKAKSKLSIWFDEDELKETSNIFDEDPTSGPI